MGHKTTAAERLPASDVVTHLFENYGVDQRQDTARSAFIDKHIDLLESSDNAVATRTGFVLRQAQQGFGIGYKVPVALIAMGQAMLGIDLAIATPIVATNPVAYTCAAIGAVYFGYNALSDNEKEALVAQVGAAVSFGLELVRSIINFAIDTLGSLMTSDNFRALKAYVAEVAADFGVSLSDITGSLLDRVSQVASGAVEGATWVASTAGTALSTTASAAWEKGRGILPDSSKKK